MRAGSALAVLMQCWSLLVPGLAAAQQPVAQAKAVVVEPEYDFGAVSEGTTVSHDFIVRNEGTVDLVIQNLVPGCGCTAASSSKDPIKPGTEGRVRVDFDTTGFSGRKHKSVRLITNDLDTPLQTVALVGVVISDISVEPRLLNFGEVVRGQDPESTNQRVDIAIREGSSVRIAGVKAYSKYLVVQELQPGELQRSYKVSLAPGVPIGEFRDRGLIVSLTGAREKSVVVPVYARVRGRIAMEPPQLSFGILEGQQPVQRSVKLEIRGSEPVSVLSLKSSHPAVSAALKVIQAGKNYVVQVSVDPKQVVRELRGSIEISTDDKEESSVSLGVYGILPPVVPE